MKHFEGVMSYFAFRVDPEDRFNIWSDVLSDFVNRYLLKIWKSQSDKRMFRPSHCGFEIYYKTPKIDISLCCLSKFIIWLDDDDKEGSRSSSRAVVEGLIHVNACNRILFVTALYDLNYDAGYL